ncbi:MAG TPA: hypothetical protein VGC42_05110 [Kofleriaceae bacterium]
MLSVWRWLARAAGSSRARAALTALVFVASSLAGVVHEAQIQHVRCAEHGELVERPAIARSATSVAPVTQLAARDAAPASALHDHCALASTARASSIDLRPPRVAPAALAISELPDALPARPVHAGGALLLTAPKTSPPRAA